ncbi:MAG: hypothetical protein ACP5D7_06390 [Limnospira sp.]
MKLNLKITETGLEPNFPPLIGLGSASEVSVPVWVYLMESPDPLAPEEALLLCERTQGEWVAWIPEYGEAILYRQQFFRIGEGG